MFQINLHRKTTTGSVCSGIIILLLSAQIACTAIQKSGRTGTMSDGSKKMNTYTDIYQMIRQEVPGVVVSGKSIMVQGPNSFFGSSQPLFVVNGVRVYNIDFINPMEVKSIKLLKGSSANIYGNDGANGVIVIDLLGSPDKNNLNK